MTGRPGAGLRAAPPVALLLLSVAHGAHGSASNEKPASTVVAPADDLGIPAGPGSGMTSLAVAPDGAVFAGWLDDRSKATGEEPGGEREEERYSFRFSELGPDGWSPPGTIASGTDWFVNWADHPSVYALGGDRLAAHWLVKSPGGSGSYGYGVRIALSTDRGATWRLIHETGLDHRTGYSGFVSLVGGERSFVAAWLAPDRATHGAGDEGGYRMTVRVARFDRDGNLLAEEEVDGDACSCCATALAVTPGGPVLAFRDRREGEIRDISITRYRDGAWTEPQTAHSDGWEIPGCPVNGPAVSADGSRLVLAWFTAAGEAPRVRAAFGKPGDAGFLAPMEVADDAPRGWVGAALLGDGSAAISWAEAVKGGSEIRVRRISADGRSGTPLTVGRGPGGRGVGVPQMVRSGERLVFGWRDEAGVRAAALPIGALPPVVSSR